ncbi:amino acid ABC transporter substrate-binding protein [Pseudoalteromonas fenneropenaei]|uniref:Amino acid ABC transporter substrate-binding protein n=1 Tax=Pseudoalteromonas fenneropenaei TaxID=1737459 RepID=A0ABV7CQD6_9GAMM
MLKPSLLMWCLVCLPLPGLAATKLHFCYEDKALPPLFMGNSLDVPAGYPGATIEILQQVDAQLPELDIVYSRKPWNRCLYEIAKNRIDAVVATYRKEREHFLVFPHNAEGELQTDLAISQFGWCLVSKVSRAAVAEKVVPFTLAIPNGYSAAQKLNVEQYPQVGASSQRHAFELVNKGVVEGSIGICQIGQDQVAAYPYANTLHAIRPPFDMSYGFMAFSKAFYQLNPALVEKIWQVQHDLPHTKLYLKYLMMGIEEQ